MKKYLWHLILVVFAVVGIVTAEHVKIANDRGRLLGQLRDAASIVSASSPDSAEANAAMQRGTLIAAGWPCHWWENQETVRSETAQLFTTLIAINRSNNTESKAAAESDKAPSNH